MTRSPRRATVSTNLKRVAPNLIQWTSTAGEDYSDLEELYGELIGQYSRYMSHVVRVVGGVYTDRKATDQEGHQHRSVPAAKQRAALAFLAENVLATPTWLLDPEILRRISHSGDIDRVNRVQSRILNQLLDPGRMQRMVEAEAAFGAEAYALSAYLEDLHVAVWKDAQSPYSRALQRAHVERLEWLMTEEPSFTSTPVNLVTSDIRALVRFRLMTLENDARAHINNENDTTLWAHYYDIAERIAAFLQGREIG